MKTSGTGTGTSSGASRRSSTLRRRSGNVRFDEHGFAVTKRKEQKVHHRCHEYSSPQMSSARVKELCELLSYWNGSSFICRSQIERFIRMGVPASLRGRVWKCLLGVDSLRENSHFNYQKCLLEVREPLVDLGVSEYGILSAITTLSDTQNHLGRDQKQPSSSSESRYSEDDITLFRQVALDLQRSFPTHRSLMGDSPEAIEGQAKLFRVLIAYAKHNPQVGYSQGMSYIAAVLLMQLGEEEAFWALTALLDQPKYLAQLFDLELTKVQHQVKVFEQLLKHRKPKLFHHLESVGVFPVHFVMPWFLGLFTSLPCWDSVLAIWDLIVLHGLSAVFHAALTITDLLESRLMDQKDEGAVLPLLLRVPVDVSQYAVLVPALCNTEVQDWELRCMNKLVLDDAQHGLKADPCSDIRVPAQSPAGPELEEADPGSAPQQSERDSGAKNVLTRVWRLAQRYLDSLAQNKAEEKTWQNRTRTKRLGLSSRSVFMGRTGTSLSQAQVRVRRRSHQRGGAVSQPVVQGGSGDVTLSPPTATKRGGQQSAPTFKRSSTGPVSRAVGRRNLTQPARVHLLSSCRKSSNQTSASSQDSITSPSSPAGPRRSEPDTPRTALIRELSSRHQSVPSRPVKESQLI